VVKRLLAVISAGMSRPSATGLLADRLAEASERALAARGCEVHSSAVELRDHGHDLVDHLVAGYPSTKLEPVLDLVARADGLIVVVPTYAGTFNGLFKLFVDVLADDVLAGKPVLIGATGGTARHSLVLEHAIRPVFTYLGAVVVPAAVYAAPEDWAGAAVPDLLAQRIGTAAEQFAVGLAPQWRHARRQ
jgi:FMN reductase